MKTLTSMTDFVLEQNEISLTPFRNILNYARFLKQPLAIYQFVPCKLVDGEWVVLEEPDMVYNDGVFGVWNGLFQNKNEYIKEYQEALGKVLFEGFENSEIGYVYLNHEIHGRLMFDEEIFEDRTIEYLVPYNLPLTKKALKEIGL